MKVHNFSAGPAILPASVLAEAADAVKNYENTGLSILEVSHRSKEVIAMMSEAETLVKELLKLNDDYAVVFLTGGASTQFFSVPMNILNENETAAYLDTGTWSAKAIKEVGNFGKVNVIGSSKESNYNFIPKNYSVPKDNKYLHITTNNTIFGTQIHDIPKTDSLLVADMSSEIFSRDIDYNAFDIIYAGAQKNLGPAGTTLVIIRKEILGKVDRNIPTMLNYQTHISKSSSFNTPPVYPIFVCMLTLRWIKAQGGLSAVERTNKAKAKLLYDEIDRNPHFKGTAAVEDRSLMNVTFVADDPAHEAAFLEYCTANGISGIKGHRSVGGFRASIYNAMPMESIEHLVGLMKNFKP